MRISCLLLFDTHHHFIVLFLVHVMKDLPERFSALFYINNIVHIVEPVINSVGGCRYVRKHSGCHVELGIVFIAVCIMR